MRKSQIGISTNPFQPQRMRNSRFYTCYYYYYYYESQIEFLRIWSNFIPVHAHCDTNIYIYIYIDYNTIIIMYCPSDSTTAARSSSKQVPTADIDGKNNNSTYIIVDGRTQWRDHVKSYRC